MIKILESDVQRACCEWLTVHRYFFWRNNNIPAPIRGGKFRAMPKYTPAGMPDVFVVKKGGMLIGIEFKRPMYEYRTKTYHTNARRSLQTPAQQDFEMRMLEIGAFYFVVHSVEELEKALDSV